MSLEAVILAKLNQGGSSQTIDALLALLPTIDAGTPANTSTTDLDPFNILFGSVLGLTMVAASTTAMNAVAASTTAMNAIAASPTAMGTMAASTTAMNTIAASPTAMSAIAASPTAMSAIAASTTAMGAIAASTTAMNALYASPSTIKINQAASATWSKLTVIIPSSVLLVRVTTFGNASGWGEGTSATNQDKILIDGVESLLSARTANPYDHSALTASPRVPPLSAPGGFSQRGINPIEYAYIHV